MTVVNHQSSFTILFIVKALLSSFIHDLFFLIQDYFLPFCFVFYIQSHTLFFILQNSVGNWQKIMYYIERNILSLHRKTKILHTFI